LTNDNKGNIRSQKIIVSGSPTLTQTYSYDQVNRLQSVSEAGSGQGWSQSFAFDIFANRWISAQTGVSLGLLPVHAQIMKNANKP
jgi:hypothetical protein